MKVLQVSTSDFLAGAERVARDLHAGLLETGVESRLLVGRRHRPSALEAEALYSRNATGRIWSRTRQWYESATGAQAAASRSFRRWLGTRTSDWDVTVCHNLHGVYFELEQLPALASVAPLVQVVHDLWLLTGHCAYPMDCPRFLEGCGTCPDLGRLPAVYFDRTARERERKTGLLLRAAPILVCVSNWVDRQVGTTRLAGLERTVIPIGIPDVPPVCESKSAIRARLGWPAGKTVYLYVSSGGLRGSIYKDPETLIGAADELVRAGRHGDKLIVTVGGRRPVSSSLESLVRQYDHVSTGLEDFFAAADVCVYPTRIETVGLVLLEAARAGLPAITTDAGGCPEIVQHGVTGLVVPPRSPAALASAMCSILSMDPVAMGRAARERFIRSYRRDRMVDTYRRLFDGLIARRRVAEPAACPGPYGVR